MSGEYGKNIYSNIRKYKCHPHVATWENFMETHVPENCCIHHLDGNKLNNDILNLVCMTRSEHMRWHATHRSEDQLKNLSNGCKHPKTEEHRKHISEGKKGRSPITMTEETKRKMSEYRKGRKLPPASEETKKKISQTKKGVSWSDARRKAQKDKKNAF